MFRFILVCMVVVGLSIFATAAQFMVSGIEGERADIAARNERPATEQTASAPDAAVTETSTQTVATIVPAEEETSPEQLNQIESAAGGDDFPSQGFTNTAPVGLEDTQPATTPAPSTDAFGDSAN